jgi:hypothetical protein
MGGKDGQEQTEPSSGRETNTHGRSVIRSLHRLSAMSFPDPFLCELPFHRVIFFSFFENKEEKFMNRMKVLALSMKSLTSLVRQ